MTGKQRTHMKPVLVTGGPRTGSTWVGRVLALAPSLCYVDEPFMPTARATQPTLRPFASRQGACRHNFDTWFTYIDSTNQEPFLGPLRDTVSLSYSWREAARFVTGISTAKDFLRGGYRFLDAKRRGSVALVKDPIAVFAAEWLSDTFDMNVIVMVRHPVAFVSSLKKANWRFPLVDLLAQDLLVKRYLGAFKGPLSEAAGDSSDIVGQALMLYRAIYGVLRDIKPNRPTWRYVTHEALLDDPVGGFAELFEFLGTEMPAAAVAELARQQQLPAEADDKTKPLDTRRNIAQNKTSWTKRLSEQEVRRILESTQDLIEFFYPEPSARAIEGRSA